MSNTEMLLEQILHELKGLREDLQAQDSVAAYSTTYVADSGSPLTNIDGWAAKRVGGLD